MFGVGVARGEKGFRTAIWIRTNRIHSGSGNFLDVMLYRSLNYDNPSHLLHHVALLPEMVDVTAGTNRYATLLNQPTKKCARITSPTACILVSVLYSYDVAILATRCLELRWSLSHR